MAKLWYTLKLYMPDEFVGGQLIKRHQPPGESGRLRGDEDLKTLKAKWQNILPPPEEIEGGYKGINWGGGENVLDQWLERPESTDPEFQILMKNFLLEKYGVGGFDELEWIATSEEKDYLSFKAKIGRAKRAAKIEKIEGKIVGLWLENIEELRDRAEGLTVEEQFGQEFLAWLGEEDKAEKKKPQRLEATLKKISPFLKSERLLEEAERRRRVVVTSSLEKIKTSAEKEQLNTWLDAWRGRFGKVKGLIFEHHPQDLDKIERMTLEVGNEGGERYFSVGFELFDRAFSLSKVLPAAVKEGPWIKSDRLVKWWRDHDFVFLSKGEDVSTAEFLNGEVRIGLRRLSSAEEPIAIPQDEWPQKEKVPTS